ncbi:MAG: family 78 glycoside hydrolase catalytic domain, partial [Clostridia bacterium]|nr:family 78 glycoside hydrolase catalytic domain [Clostridia bacterium]
MFNSKWITTKEFINLEKIDIYHKEHDKKTLSETPEELKNNSCRFKKTFLAAQSKCYKIRISADDYYKLYVNGKFVCQGPAPAYEDNYYYNEADITPFIIDGENLVAVEVYYQGCNNRVWNSADNRQGMIADIYENDKFIFGTDESWVYSYAKEYSGSPSIGYKTQYTENIDFNKADSSWKTDLNLSGTEKALINEKDDHKFTSCVPTVSVYTLKPESINKLGVGHYIIDMGKEYTGQLHFTLKGKKDEKVILRHGEELNEDGTVRFDMRCNCRYEEVLTLSGETDETDFYDYKAFRYAEIISESDSVIEDSIEMIVRHHKFDDEGFYIKSSEPLLEDIWKICAQALKIGVQEGYLDCPSREKGQYLGDFVVSGLAHMYLTGDSEMYKKTLREFALSSKISEGIMAVAPGSFMQEIADFSLLYPKAVYNYFKYTNDTEFIKEILPVLDGLLEYFKGYENERGLLEGVVEKWNLVDWPDNLRDGYDFELKNPPKAEGCHNVINAYY